MKFFTVLLNNQDKSSPTNNKSDKNKKKTVSKKIICVLCEIQQERKPFCLRFLLIMISLIVTLILSHHRIIFQLENKCSWKCWGYYSCFIYDCFYNCFIYIFSEKDYSVYFWWYKYLAFILSIKKSNGFM